MRLVNNIVSPYGLAGISYVFFLIACAIPPSIYSHYMGEPDLMFLNTQIILFYSLCVFAFLFGAWFVSYIFPSSYAPRTIDARIPVNAFLLVPLVVGMSVTTVSILLLIRGNSNIVLLLLAQQGGDLKHAVAFDAGGNFTFAPLMLIAIIWWAYWRSGDLRDRIRWPLRIAFPLALLLVVISSVLTLSRNLVMVASMGLIILGLSRRAFQGALDIKIILKTGTTAVILVGLLFFGFSFLRGIENWDAQISQLFGYTLVSYNRLAAVMNGTLCYPYSGSGIYISPFVAFNHSFNRLIPLASYFNWPDHLDVWNSEFAAVSDAGLDARLIWSGAFGDLFSDLGWFAPAVLLGYGLWAGFAWRLLKRGMALGVVLYPCIGFCVLFWIGSNYLLDSDPFVVYVIAILLAFYERCFLNKIPLSRTSES